MLSVIAPLKKREEQAAIKSATAHLAGMLSDRYRVFGAELRIEKPARPRAAPERAIAVVVVDYGNRRTLEVITDPNGKVLGVDERAIPPAWSREEITEARAIAERDSLVARVAKLKGVFVSEFGPEPARDNARRIGLRYAVVRKGRLGAELLHAIVDLSAATLVRIEQLSVNPNRRS
ncbi:MAG: hypothetical protein ABJD07_11500 [Gemmatimonadaceae bacterium]